MSLREKILKNFIVFEGLDGSGTTTQLHLLKNYFETNNKLVFTTNEPTKNAIGSLIKKEYLSGKTQATALTLALLYAADREDHLNNPIYGIKQQLNEGKIVLQDRYFYSSLAYQNVEVDYNFIDYINNYESPEYLIFIDTDIDECLNRIDLRGEKREIFEKKEFLNKTLLNYKNIFSHLNRNIKFKTVDGNQSKDDIFKDILFFLKDIK